MAVSMIGPKFYAWNRDGKPLAFGKLYTYQARTNTPKPTYQSEDQVVENTNPVILNGEGYTNVYLDGSYKMVLKDDKDNEIWSSDPVTSAQAKEWVNCLPASYISPASLSVGGNQTDHYFPGRRVRIDNNLTEYSYSEIVSSSYASGETSISVSDSVVTTGIRNVCTSVVSPNSSFDKDDIAKYTDIAFNSTSDMIDGIAVGAKNNIIHKKGQLYITTGYRSSGDGGGASYLVTDSYAGAPDGIVDFDIGGGLFIVLQPKPSMNIRQFGARCNASEDGTSGDDDAQYWKAATEWQTQQSSRVEIVCDSPSLLYSSSLQNGTGIWGAVGGINLLTGNEIRFIDNGAWVLQPNTNYPQVAVPGGAQTDITLRKVKVLGNGAWANGLVWSGTGGEVNRNIRYYDCEVHSVKSENYFIGEDLNRREGGAAYVAETDATGGIYNCLAIDCSVARRFAPETDINISLDCIGFRAEECETLLSTNPSNFDNRDYAQDATYNKRTEPMIRILGDSFRNCGASTDELTQLSFIWKDTSGDSGIASGNYYPWAGIKRGVFNSTYSSMNWQPDNFNAADTEWSGAATYNHNDRVKVTNSGNLGSLYGFARSCSIQIIGVKGWNDHFTGGYPKIGAMFRGIMSNVDISDVNVDVSCDSIYHFGTSPSASFSLQPFMLCKYVNAKNVTNLGSTVYAAFADMPINGNWKTTGGAIKTVDFQYNQESVSVDADTRSITQILHSSLKSVAPSQATTFNATNTMRFRNITTGSVREGDFKSFAAFLSNPTNDGARRVYERIEFTDKIQFFSEDRGIYFGQGSPEGVVTANKGSLYLNLDGGAGVSMYVKESGAGNTGWVGK